MSFPNAPIQDPIGTPLDNKVSSAPWVLWFRRIADFLTTPKFGNDPNYTTFESDGSLVMYGDASVYDDALGSLLGQRLESPSSAIVENIAEAALDFKITCRYPADYVVPNTQLTHRWKAASSVHPHLHWEQTTANTPNWLIGFRWQRNGQAKTTTWTLSKTVSNAFTYTSGTLNQISTFADIVPPDGYNISDIVQVKLYRDYTNVSTLFTGNDPVNATVLATWFDSHVETDRLGSRTEYSR